MFGFSLALGAPQSHRPARATQEIDNIVDVSE